MNNFIQETRRVPPDITNMSFTKLDLTDPSYSCDDILHLSSIQCVLCRLLLIPLGTEWGGGGADVSSRDIQAECASTIHFGW